MDYNTFIVKLADIFEKTLEDKNDNFDVSPDEWDSLATLAAIALLHEAFDKNFPLKTLQHCSSAKEIYRLGSSQKETGGLS